MNRTNTFLVVPRTSADEDLLRRLLDASASLWNELTYERRQQFFGGESVWDTADYRKQYVGVLGSGTAQQVIRKNSEAWRSFFATRENGEKKNHLHQDTGATRTRGGSYDPISATINTRFAGATDRLSRSQSANI